MAERKLRVNYRFMKCLECSNSDNIAYARVMEAEWESHPIEVEEIYCEECKRYRHWWLFWFTHTSTCA